MSGYKPSATDSSAANTLITLAAEHGQARVVTDQSAPRSVPREEAGPTQPQEVRPSISGANDAMAALQLLATAGNEGHPALGLGPDMRRAFHNFSVERDGHATEGTAPTGQEQNMDVDSDEYGASAASDR